MAESKKVGRGKRSPARASYKAGSRWEVNKRKRIARAELQKKRDAARKPKVPRGTARAKRRAHLQT